MDIAGWPCDYDAIMEWVQSDEVRALFQPNGEQREKLDRPLVLADAAHSFGATYKGHLTGSLARPLRFFVSCSKITAI